MAKEAQKNTDYNWRLASGEKLQDDMRRLQEENEYLKKLLWNSPNSWLEKQRAAELVKEEATEMAVETRMRPTNLGRRLGTIKAWGPTKPMMTH